MMTTTQTTEQSLAALLKVAPPELREVLTRKHRQLGRVALPVPEATLAAMQWWPLSKRGRTIHIIAARDGSVLYSAIDHDGTNQHWYDGPDIFAAIRAALEAE